MKLETKAATAFALGLLIIVLVGVGSFIGIQRVAESNRMVAHTHQVLEKLEQVLSLLKDAETGQRGFVLTGEEDYLEPYNAAVGSIGPVTAALASLTRDNPAQQQDIRLLAQLTREKLAELRETIELRREGRRGAALAVIRSDRGMRAMDGVRAVVGRMTGREWQLLAQRDRAAGKTALDNSRMVGIGMLLALLVLTAIAIVMTRSLRLAEHGPEAGGAGGKRRAGVVRYGLAVVAVGLAMLLRQWVVSAFGPIPIFITFYPTVLLVASIAGGGPGVLATLLAVLAADYWYLEPIGQFGINSPNDAIALGIFGSASMFLCVLAERLHRARMAEAASRAQEQELALLDMGSLVALDPDRRIVRWSEGCCRLYGFSAREAQGRPVDELLQTRFSRPLEEIRGDLLERGHWEGEMTRIARDGTELALAILLALRCDGRGRPLEILEANSDITPQKRAEAALRESEATLQAAYEELQSQSEELQAQNEELRAQSEELQAQSEELQAQSEELHAQNDELTRLWGESRRTEAALAESQERLSLALAASGMATFDWDLVTNRRSWDDTIHALLGTTPETLTGAAEDHLRVLHPDDRGNMQAALTRAIGADGDYETEYRVIWPDGAIRHIACQGKVHHDDDGRANRVLGICWDVTGRKQAEEALTRLNEELEGRVAERTAELAATIEQLRVEIEERQRSEESVRRLNRLYEVLSETNKSIARTRDRDALFRDFCRIAVEQGGFLLSWVGLLDEESGQVKSVAAWGATGYLDDIRVSANQEPDGIGPTGLSVREGTYYVCNDFQNDPCTRPWHEKGRNHGINASASVALKEEGRVIGALTLYGGTRDYFDRQHTELLVRMGTDVSFALDNIVREARRREAEQALREETVERLRVVEALREKERMLIQQSRQAAMGEMIGNIAHQWRQPLNVLGLNVQQLLLFYDAGQFDREFLAHGVDSSMKLIQHMSRTIDDFRNYFRPDKEKVEFRLSEAVAGTLALMEDSFKSQRIAIEVMNQDDPAVTGYRNEFAQVILNILSNAGDIFRERRTDDPRVTITIGSEEGKAVVAIVDNAGGIPPEIVEKVFDPYFTTKGPQSGTGLGLFMSKTIIEKNMGGRLSARNVGDGAEFRIEV